MVSLFPSLGPVEGSTIVTIRGMGFDVAPTGSSCRFGAFDVSVLKATSSYVLCSAPRSESTVSISLEVQIGGRQCVGISEYSYVSSVSVMGLQPSRGPVDGGTTITVMGNNLVDGALKCRFGRQTVTEAGPSFVSSTMILCFAPRSNQQGPVNVEISVNGGADYTTGG